MEKSESGLDFYFTRLEKIKISCSFVMFFDVFNIHFNPQIVN